MDYSDVVSRSVNNVIKILEKTIGLNITIKLISETSKKIKSTYEYVKDIEISEQGKVNFKFKRKISEKEAFEILINTLGEIELAYSKIIGPLGRDAFKEGLSSFIEGTEEKLKRVKKH